MVTDHISSSQKICKKWLYGPVWLLFSASAAIALLGGLDKAHHFYTSLP